MTTMLAFAWRASLIAVARSDHLFPVGGVDGTRARAASLSDDEAWFVQQFGESVGEALPNPVVLRDDWRYFQTAAPSPRRRAESAPGRRKSLGLQGL
jgi:hypothetical protein